jgi:ABC-type dipeptide/oligopeptide/nickel transport system permease subunit
MKVPWSAMLLVGVTMVAALVIIALLAPLLAPYDPRLPVGPSLAAPSADHLFGTNVLGQDIFSRIVWGARSSLAVALGSTTLAISVGTLVGVSSGLIGGTVDALAMRVVDICMALPRLPLLVLVAALVGPNRLTMVLLIGFVFFAAPARIFRSQTLTVRQRGFVQSARGFGGGNTILFAATLAFLGLADPTDVSWGLMLNSALATPGLYFTSAWIWLVLPAGFAISLAVLGFTFLGVGLEPLVNPRWQR